MSRLALVIMLMIFSSTLSSAADIVVGDGLILTLETVDGWVVHSSAPEALVGEIAEHIAHESEAQGYSPTPDEVRQAALKRLAANEAIVYHAASKSHIDIDFSPISLKEKAPQLKTLKGSAGHAVQSLEGEEGVSGLQHTIRVVDVAGAGEAARLEAKYKHHDEAVTFIGLIGYVDRAWFFLYVTVFGDDPSVVKGAEAILDSVIVRSN